MRIKCFSVVLLCCIVCPVFSQVQQPANAKVLADIPRTILALYKGSEAPLGIADHPLHRFLEMPLNHLGLKVRYWDISKGIPDVSKIPPLRGIISWFYADEMEKPEEYLTWAAEQIKLGAKYLVVENLGAYKNLQKKLTPKIYLHNFFNMLGLSYQDRWVKFDPTANFVFDDERFVYFEQHWMNFPPGINAFTVIDSKVNQFISIEMLEEKLPLATINKNGGTIIEKYLIEIGEDRNYLGRWVVNPFHFLRLVFATDDLPKPDVTTINGRRLYFSHIDGDGWRNVTLLQEYANQGKYSADVILEKAILPFNDLPVTVAPIAAELDPSCLGTEKAQEIARRLFELPNVEGASHTYTHPFDWAYYDNENPAAKEEKEFGKQGKKKSDHYDAQKTEYELPRAYFCVPFDLKNELQGSIDFIRQFLPHYKEINLIQWSGNCRPYETALATLSKSKILNLNGGDSRFDKEFPSYSSVCPVGRRVNEQLQIYAVNSNENTYTDGWTRQFHAFKFLKKTFENTETPVRVKGMNIYYHMYSGEKEASMAAVVSNLNYARSQKIIPIQAVDYVKVGIGFFSTRILPEADNGWRILNREGLQTIRFDRASDMWIDLEKCEGVMGAIHHQGSLYVTLDPADASPLVVLKEGHEYFEPPTSSIAYLLESRWRVWELKRNKKSFSFQAQGYGQADMSWGVPHPGIYIVETLSDKKATTQEVEVSVDQILRLQLDIEGYTPVIFRISAK